MTTLCRENIHKIRDVLILGLEAYGEIQRVREAVNIKRICNVEIPAEVVPYEVGNTESVSDFAHALSLVACLDRFDEETA